MCNTKIRMTDRMIGHHLGRPERENGMIRKEGFDEVPPMRPFLRANLAFVVIFGGLISDFRWRQRFSSKPIRSGS